MPLYKTIHISPAVVAHIWKISETEEELQQGVILTDKSQRRVKGMKSELHRRGFLSIRHLMWLEGYEDKDLFYDEAGKPHLHNGYHISITHSYEFTGIIISKKERVGIDIEKQREKIIRIAHKFTTFNTVDEVCSKEDLVKKLTLLWGAKESVYKIYAAQGLSFLQHIFIDPANSPEIWFRGQVNYEDSQSSYQIKGIEFEGFTCVYALKK